MSDEEHFIHKVEKSHERWTGESWNSDKTRENFALYGKARRIQAMEQLDEAVRQEPATNGNLRKYTQLTALQRDLELLHSQMVKVGR